MENCPKCKSEKRVKNGHTISGEQRWNCKNCGRNYSVEFKSNNKSDEMKTIAKSMYLEGLGFRSIGRILKVSHVSVFNWIKKFGKEEKEKFKEKKQKIEHKKIIEMDEIHTYLGKKKLRMDMDSS
jgi:transposase-like protein